MAVELGQLALALEQAGAYIVRYKSTLAGYLEEWQKRHERVLAWFDERLMQYPWSVAVTWQTSFDRLSQPARRLLQLLSWLAPDPIPELLLEAGGGPFAVSHLRFFQKLKEFLSFHRAERYANARDALAELAEHSLLKRSDEEPTFSVHRLVQDVTRRTLPERTKLPCLKQALRWVDLAFVGDPSDVRSWPNLEPLMPHARTIAAFADEWHVLAPTVGLMNQVGLLLATRAHFAEAELMYRRARAICEQKPGASRQNAAGVMNNLGELFQATNRMAEAEPLHRRALAIDERNLGPDHPHVAIHLHNLAHLLEATNRVAESEELMRRALVIDERNYGPDHPDVAIHLSNLALLLKATKRKDEAELLMRRVLAIFERHLGENHPNVATALNNLAFLMESTNRGAQAEMMYRRALMIDELSYGLDHPDVAIRLNNLAQLLQTKNRMAEAEPLIRRALGIWEQTHGESHPNVATALSCLASCSKPRTGLATLRS